MNNNGSYDSRFWTIPSDGVLSSVKNKILSKYPGFNFKYDWKKYPEIQDYLLRLMASSMVNALANKNNELYRRLPELINDVEEFFESGIKAKIFDEKNIYSILDRLKDANKGFRVIEFLPPEYSGVYGISLNERIYINSNSTRHKNSPSLTSDEIRRLYIFHEMGHKVLNISKQEEVINDYINTFEKILSIKGMSMSQKGKDKGKELVKEGFLMIEESLTQELAEYLTYFSANKKRPHYRKDRDLGCDIVTNHDYYGIFQMPTVSLGETIMKDSNNKTAEEILLNTIKLSINSNFILELVSQYSHGNGQLYYDLYSILTYMGAVKINKYASFGNGSPITFDMGKALKEIREITTKNRDVLQDILEKYRLTKWIDFKDYQNDENEESQIFSNGRKR